MTRARNGAAVEEALRLWQRMRASSEAWTEAVHVNISSGVYINTLCFTGRAKHWFNEST